MLYLTIFYPFPVQCQVQFNMQPHYGLFLLCEDSYHLSAAIWTIWSLLSKILDLPMEIITVSKWKLPQNGTTAWWYPSNGLGSTCFWLASWHFSCKSVLCSNIWWLKGGKWQNSYRGNETQSSDDNVYMRKLDDEFFDNKFLQN